MDKKIFSNFWLLRGEVSNFNFDQYEYWIYDNEINNITYDQVKSLIPESANLRKVNYLISKSIDCKNFIWNIIHFLETKNAYSNEWAEVKLLFNCNLINTQAISELILDKIQKIKIFVLKNTSNNLLKIGEIKITDFDIQDGVYDFNNFEIDNFVFDSFSNNAKKFILTDLVIHKLEIRNADLWRMIFNWVKIWKLTLENATLNDCIFNGVTFESYELWDEIDWKKVPLERLKDNYRQLKYVMDKNNNYIEANKFYELEMETYMRIIYWVEKISIFSIFDIFSQKFLWMKSKNLSSFIQLYFWYQISEFWNNWLRVISLFFILAIVSTSLWFASYLFSLGNEWYYLVKPSLIYIWSSAHFFKTYKYISSNLFGDFVALSIIVCCFLAPIIYKHFINNYISWLVTLREGKYIKGIIKYIGSKFKIFSKIIGVTFLLLLLLFVYTSNYNFIWNFLNYLMPLYWFNLEDLKTYNAIELLGLIVYKLIYILLLSHLVIALKRTTKR